MSKASNLLRGENKKKELSNSRGKENSKANTVPLGGDPGERGVNATASVTAPEDWIVEEVEKEVGSNFGCLLGMAGLDPWNNSSESSHTSPFQNGEDGNLILDQPFMHDHGQTSHFHPGMSSTQE